MTKSFSTKRMLLGVATIASETSDPNSGAGTSADPGSLWLRNGDGISAPTQTFLNLAGTPTGWSLQNLINLKVFNVRSFGATGNGVTDDGPAINSAIASATASGIGGIIYFPPGVYRVTRPVSGVGSFLLSNVHDLVFLGDGFNSQIAMIGSSSFSDWYMFRVVSGSSRLTFANLSFVADITDKDPAEQNHFINIAGTFGDPNGPPNNIDVIGCYFRFTFGDGVRTLGEIGARVSNIDVLYNDFDMTASRSCIEAQRFTDAVNFSHNFCSGSQDQQIDFEPTSGEGPTNWTIVGNHLDHTTAVTAAAAITLSGAGNSPASSSNRRATLAFNTITGGGVIGGVKGLSSSDLVGNIITVNQVALSAASAVIDFGQRVQDCSFVGNVCINETDINHRIGIRLLSNPGLGAFADHCNLSDNIVTAIGEDCQGMALADTTEMVVDGNIIQVTTTVPALVSSGVTATAIEEEVDHFTSTGNMIIGVTNRLKFAFHYNCSTEDVRNVVASYNYVRNSFSIVFMSLTTGDLFLDWRNVNANNGVAISGFPIQGPSTLEGVTLEGSAGPGPQFTLVQNAPGPETLVTAPVGSVGLNSSGGQGTVLWMKESGIGVTGGKTGWVQQGATELCMGAQDVGLGTAALFLAPGTGLLTAGATEIQFVVTRPGLIRNVRYSGIAGVGVSTVTYTLRKNGVNTTALVAVANTAATGSGTGSFTVVAGDRISVSVAKSAIVATAQTQVAITFELTS